MRETLKTRLLKRMDRKHVDVFLRADFTDLGGYDQVGRTLRELVRQGRLMKIGYGLYSRAVKSPFDDRPIPPKGLSTLREALKRVGIETLPSRSMLDHNAGRAPGADWPRCWGTPARTSQDRLQRIYTEL